MKEQWWTDKAAELQQAADRHDTKRFHDGLKAVFGPRNNEPALDVIRLESVRGQ